MEIIILILTGLLLINQALLAYTLYLISKLEKVKFDNIAENKKKNIRKHTKIQPTNYESSFNNRAYDIYKNSKTGLYEPQKPHNGIELKETKED